MDECFIVVIDLKHLKMLFSGDNAFVRDVGLAKLAITVVKLPEVGSGGAIELLNLVPLKMCVGVGKGKEIEVAVRFESGGATLNVVDGEAYHQRVVTPTGNVYLA